jgi:hypothetical protein
MLSNAEDFVEEDIKRYFGDEEFLERIGKRYAVEQGRESTWADRKERVLSNERCMLV